MDIFDKIIIDTKGEADLTTKDRFTENDDKDDVDFKNATESPSILFDIEEDLLENKVLTKKEIRNPDKDIDLEQFELDMGWTKEEKRKEKVTPKITSSKTVDKILEKSVITPGFETLRTLPPYELSKKRLQEMRRKERSKTKGKNWFNMSAPELTPEVKHDLQVIRMRSVLDPKHFYKKNDIKDLPKYFQVGKVMDSPLDYYSGRLTKKERKKTIVDELMADANFCKQNKKKYKEIISEKRKYKAHMHSKKLKGKKGKKK